MSGLDLLEAEELVSETVTKPPTRWRNWWRMPRRIFDHVENRWLGPGDILISRRTWASHDLAETDAKLTNEAGLTSEFGYLGAHPDGETP